MNVLICDVATESETSMDRATVLDRVHAILQRHLGSPQRAQDGQFEFPADSTVCRVGVLEQQSGRTLVSVSAFVLGGVSATPQLYEYVALHADDWVFGHLCAELDVTSNTVLLSMRHTLLGSTLDPDELVTAVIDLSAVANELDDDLQRRFGGRRWID